MNDEAGNSNELNLNDILKVRRQKYFELIEKNNDPFKITKYNVDCHTSDIVNSFDSMEGQSVSVAGRMMSKREMGKASFCDILDRDGKIQVYIKVDAVGDEKYEEFKKFDIGDILGIQGMVFKTHRGEVSIKAEEITLLAKSLRPLPEKWHGLKDTDLRYRQRYVDLIVNGDVRNTFIMRSRIISQIRKFLDGKGFLEVETPLLQTIPGGANARPFITHHNTLDIDLYLRIALELYLKRLIVGGLERVYEIGRVFRNEGISIKHNPEFTMAEIYQAYTDYHGMMDLTEELINTVAEQVLNSKKVNYQGETIDFSRPWKRITMIDAVKTYTGVDFNEITSDEQALSAAKKLGVKIQPNTPKGEILSVLFEEFAEKHFIQPTFVIDYPVEVSPLTKRKPDMPDFTERFELFIAGREVANAYSEINDPIDQRERFLKQVEKREAGDEEANMMDEDFINALEYGMPPTGGLGIGIDRLVMFFTDSYSIRDVLLFPTMKPQE